MPNFFHRLEAERRAEDSVYFQKILIGAEIGILALAAAIRFAVDPTSISDYAYALGAIPVGSCIAAAIIDQRES